MRYLAITAFALIVGVTGAVAQNTAVVVERHDTFEDIGKAAKPVIAMFKDKADFDLAKVQSALAVIVEKGTKVKDLFPEDSKTGITSHGKPTRALPAIWENKTDFDARLKKFIDKTTEAQSTIKDEVSFKTSFKTVMGTCSGCHKKYRAKKK